MKKCHQKFSKCQAEYFKHCNYTVTLDLRDLHSWRVEAHIVDSTTGWMDPAVTQSLLQSLVGNVEADDQVKLVQIIQSLGLRQSPGKA